MKPNVCRVHPCMTILPPGVRRCTFHGRTMRARVPMPPRSSGLLTQGWTDAPICGAILARMQEPCARRLGHTTEHRSDWSVRYARESRRTTRTAVQ